MNKLFEDFNPISAKAWKQKIQVDLKGADYNNTLIWKTKEGIDVKPFYHPDDDLPPYNSFTKATQWTIGEYIKVTNQKTANKQAIKAIKEGAERIGFELDNYDISIESLLSHIDLSKTIVDLYCHFPSEHDASKLIAFTSKAVETSHINIHTDIIGNLAQTGNWYTNLQHDFKTFELLVNHSKQISINTSLYQNAGANMVQQLAYALAHANEYLNHFHKVSAKETLSSLQVNFNISIGSNYFFEIAKQRALRQLWDILANEYGVNSKCQIIATPSLRNKTIYDYNVNMLRTTTECMSAILGGANAIYNLPYDVLFNAPNNFGNRISRNQLLVLKHESYFNKVNNPADGAYYIESLTNDLAEKALELFKHIETNDGFLSQLKAGTIQRKIKENAAKEQEEFDTEKIILLGTNKHPNKNDNMKNNLEINPFLKIEKRKTLIEPIIQKRLSEQLEINRLENE